MARHWRLAVCRPSSVECRSCGPPRRFCVRRSRREEGAATTSMRPLLQHASRAHISNASAITSTVRPIGRFAAQSPLACITCQHRQASTVLGSIERPRTDSNGLSRWALRRFSSSPRWAEDKKPPSSSFSPKKFKFDKKPPDWKGDLQPFRIRAKALEYAIRRFLQYASGSSHRLGGRSSTKFSTSPWPAR